MSQRNSFCIILLLLFLSGISSAAAVSAGSPDIQLTVDAAGTYTISVANPPWTFGGNVGQSLNNLAVQAGSDHVDSYREVSFSYVEHGPRAGAIRVYSSRKLVLFTVQYLADSPNVVPFPQLSTYPRIPYHLTFSGIFGIYAFDRFGADSPWLYFDSDANAFLLSPASHFMEASTSLGPNGEIASGINSAIATLPAGFTQQTWLAVESGINRTFESWGHAMTDFQNKTRPANDADLSLARLGYWTDAGASYYYKYEQSLGYAGTLLAMRDDFARQGIGLGYVQLDSWFYPKGAGASWTDKSGGIQQYVADPTLFPGGLKAFQSQLGIPLITHARWIDAASPYRQQYAISGNVSIDPNYWDRITTYLHDAGTVTYEQDWLGAQAQTAFDLVDPETFLDDMAAACARKAQTVEYCMPLPRHYLQSTRYGNVTTMRTSQDRFDRSRWDQFLYDSRLASSLGVWPWSDVFMSSEADNLLISTLSAGPVGVGDKLGAINKANLLQAVRPDGVIVKPDVPLTPVDNTFILDAQSLNTPMVASTYTDFGTMKFYYVLAYNRGANATVMIKPASLGIASAAYLYNYYTGSGRLVETGGTFSETPANGSAYYIIAPVGRSGIAFLGDEGQFVSLGKKRIAQVMDSGALGASILFAAGEGSRTLHGYSPSAPIIRTIKGSAGPTTYDRSTGLFSVAVSPDVDGTAVVTIQQSRLRGIPRP